MPEPESRQTENLTGWLVFKSGPMAGRRHLLAKASTRVGRDPTNDIVFEGEDARIVSSRHMEIRFDAGAYHLYDLGSTNGTYVNGARVADAPLEAEATIRLGPVGPELRFELESLPVSDAVHTMPMAAAVPENRAAPAAPNRGIAGEHEELLSAAVRQARRARDSGESGQTAIIMREMLGTAIHRSSRRFKRIIRILVLALIAISAYAAWNVRKLRHEKSNIDTQIRDIEAMLSREADSEQIEALIDKLQGYEERAVALQRNLLYRLGVRSFEQDFVEQEIKTLLAEFGAEEYSIPPEFIVQVNRFIRQYQERDRPHMERLLSKARDDIEIIRSVLQGDNLPPDLAYMVLVESAFIAGDESTAGAAGLWQFTPMTARAYGMKVDGSTDERLDIHKSTRGASRYIRELILEFGSGSSVMLALAAYNVGPAKVKRAIRTVTDPIKQRNFWYLYRMRALPVETREYVPKTFAAMIIGRTPRQFGF